MGRSAKEPNNPSIHPSWGSGWSLSSYCPLPREAWRPAMASGQWNTWLASGWKRGYN